MPTRLVSVVVDAGDVAAQARFWAEVLDRPAEVYGPDEAEVAVGPFDLVFVQVPEPKAGKNRAHLDLASPEGGQAALVARLEGLGARRVDVGQGEVPWVVLADPEGNEFCVLEPRERYARTGPVAAVVVDTPDPVASRDFWAAASAWAPAETSYGTCLRAPDGPYLEFLPSTDPKAGKDRLHLDVAPWADDPQAAEVERLRAAGATPLDIGQGEVSWVVLADPVGAEFCVLSSRA